jgi:TRAP-type mannitol/chloroaromatic compound transport system permease large subunit
MSLDMMPPLMFGGLVLFLLAGFPAAFSLSAVGLFFGFVSIELGFFNQAFLGNLPLRVFGILYNDLLLAIPFASSACSAPTRRSIQL